MTTASRTAAHRADPVKASGVHYTPPELAAFVARAAWRHLDCGADGPVRVLDPACGDGSLLAAVARTAPSGRSLEMVGYDIDSEALDAASRRLDRHESHSVQLRRCDFLGELAQPSLLGQTATPPAGFDLVVANPPYVRTQTLGAERSRALAAQFSLRGRLDLYHAFALGMAGALADQGVMALLSSNRFMTVKSGRGLREQLRSMDLREVYDLGDTRLFEAAVLPAVTVAVSGPPADGPVRYVSVYEDTASDEDSEAAEGAAALLRALEDEDGPGAAVLDGRPYAIRRGTLSDDGRGSPWSLRTSGMEWLDALEKRAAMRLGDLGPVRVGIKTTADAVFIRDDWSSVVPAPPEDELLRPLLTHHVADRWVSRRADRSVLYPYDMSKSKRTPLELGDYPRADAYLREHRERLASRQYVIDAGREWWEIWVPQKPAQWRGAKIVFPDIAEEPRFSLDETGSVVNGDCYWIPVEALDEDVAMLAIGIANSTVATAYYDARCGNRLYSGRRRYVTQYVKDFPLPDPESSESRLVIKLTSELVDGGHCKDRNAELEAELDAAAWASFGLEQVGG